MKFADGVQYFEGEFAEGTQKKGYGKLIDPIGQTYEVGWVDGEKNGKGKKWLYGKLVYEGEY